MSPLLQLEAPLYQQYKSLTKLKALHKYITIYTHENA